MQNKPNLLRGKTNATFFATKDYKNKSNWTLSKNKPKQSQFPKSPNECKLTYNKGLQKKRRFRSPKKQTQNKPNLLDFQMNVSNIIKKDYDNERLYRRSENKANTNPNKPKTLII